MERKIVVLAACALLSACAGTSTRDGLVYKDGSWYSPAGETRGDYYTSSPVQPQQAWDHPWNFSVGMLPYGGYCPVRYRYCTSFWADPFWGPRYYAYYDPYWYEPWHWHHHHPSPHAQQLPPPPRVVHELRPRPRNPEDRPRPRMWEERPSTGPRRDGPGSSSRARRRPAMGVGGGRE